MTETTAVPTITLNDGRAIPQLGFGVFQVPPDDTREVTGLAFEVGYRHVDTAEMYRNEKGIGEAVRESGLSRKDIWITSKLNNDDHRPDDARRAFDATLRALGREYGERHGIATEAWSPIAQGDDHRAGQGRARAHGARPRHLRRQMIRPPA